MEKAGFGRNVGLNIALYSVRTCSVTNSIQNISNVIGFKLLLVGQFNRCSLHKQGSSFENYKLLKKCSIDLRKMMFWKWSLGLMQRIRMVVVRERVACFLSCRKIYIYIFFFVCVWFF